MFKNYIKLAFRNIQRHKGYSAINVLGLSVGLACVIIISMIIWNEISFDKFHVNKDGIYRLYIENSQGGDVVRSAPIMIPFAPAAKAEIPELEYAVRISHRGILSSFNDKKFYEKACFVDDNFFVLFSFKFIKGNPATALSEPNTVVITKNIAEKYFGDENPIGKSLVFDGKEHFVITGVIKNLPFNSHIQDDIFASFNSYNESNFPRLNEWGSFSNDFTYVMLKHGTNPEDVEKKLNAVMKSHTDEPFRSRAKMKMQKLTDVHFSKLIHDDAQTTPLLSLYIFGAIGIFILIIAAINFINLTTARASKRNKEIGIRKVSGAGRLDLVFQFLSEAFALTIISAAVALLIASVLIPQVNEILKLNLSLNVLYNFNFLMLTAAVLVFTALTAGAYPAFVLSRQIPAVILKKNVVKKGGYSLRAVLVVFQFAISVFLIIGTFTVFNQIDYMLSKDLGFPKDQIVVLNNNDENIQHNGAAFKQILLNSKYIKAASYSSGTPGSNTSSTINFTPEGGDEKDEIIMQVIDVDYDFLNTFDLKMKQGRFFSRDFSTDTSDAYILNETAVKKLGWQNPIGKRITIGGADTDSKYCSVVGVLPDFNYSSLQNEINPTVFRLNPNGGRFLSCRLNTKDIAAAIDFIRQKESVFSPAYPLDFFFIKERFENYNRGGIVIGKMLGFFSALAVILSCIGILGLISYSIEQKSKEIGVRKVLGASVAGIVFLLCREFVKWVLIANVIVWPLAYLAVNKFLNNFAYRTDVNYLIFGLTLLISLFITLATVAFHTIKAAVANPVESLRYE